MIFEEVKEIEYDSEGNVVEYGLWLYRVRTERNVMRKQQHKGKLFILDEEKYIEALPFSIGQ